MPILLDKNRAAEPAVVVLVVGRFGQLATTVVPAHNAGQVAIELGLALAAILLFALAGLSVLNPEVRSMLGVVGSGLTSR